MTSAELEPAIPASERPQTHALDREATGTGNNELFFFFAVALRVKARRGLLILDVSRSHTTTQHSR
jgi:hypothetical protein